MKKSKKGGQIRMEINFLDTRQQPPKQIPLTPVFLGAFKDRDFAAVYDPHQNEKELLLLERPPSKPQEPPSSVFCLQPSWPPKMIRQLSLALRGFINNEESLTTLHEHMMGIEQAIERRALQETIAIADIEYEDNASEAWQVDLVRFRRTHGIPIWEMVRVLKHYYGSIKGAGVDLPTYYRDYYPWSNNRQTEKLAAQVGDIIYKNMNKLEKTVMATLHVEHADPNYNDKGKCVGDLEYSPQAKMLRATEVFADDPRTPPPHVIKAVKRTDLQNEAVDHYKQWQGSIMPLVEANHADARIKAICGWLWERGAESAFYGIAHLEACTTVAGPPTLRAVVSHESRNHKEVLLSEGWEHLWGPRAKVEIALMEDKEE